jgi:two-component system NtrC family response regulator
MENANEASGDRHAGAARATPPARPAAVLVVDDEPGMRNFLCKALAPLCALVESAASVDEAEALRQRYHFDLMIIDVRLPGESGSAWLTRLREQSVSTDVIVMSAYASVETAVASLRAGASDFLLKPFRIEQMLSAVQRCLAHRDMARENYLLRRSAPATASHPGIIGQSRAMQALNALIQRVAATNATLLVEGETGTGKELVARAVHEGSGRSGPFVPVNCGSIAADLLESELFGHVKGAFTGAHSQREGLFCFAEGGTLFLDEIGELPLAMQAKLLRVLEEKRVRPVGSDRELPVNARVVAATNRRLREEVVAGRFREDLYFRLNVMTLRVPSLRERTDDVGMLADHFSQVLSQDLGVDPLPLDHHDVERLKRYDWPGNVRELRNVVERSLLLGRLTSDTLNAEGEARRGTEPGSGAELDLELAEVEKRYMLRMLEHVGGNKSEAARRLGVSRKTLERKLKQWAPGS